MFLQIQSLKTFFFNLNSQSFLLLPFSSGVMETGWTSSLMTASPLSTTSWSSPSLLREMSSGAPCWRRPTPSEWAEKKIEFKCKRSICVSPTSVLYPGCTAPTSLWRVETPPRPWKTSLVESLSSMRWRKLPKSSTRSWRRLCREAHSWAAPLMWVRILK